METLLAPLVLAVLAVPVLLVVALVSISGLKRRVADLEEVVVRLRAGAEAASRAPAAAQREAAETGSAPSQAAAPTPATASEIAPVPAPAVSTGEPTVASAQSQAGAASPVSPAWPPPPENRIAKLLEDKLQALARQVRQWFSTGNVPVKVGVLVLFAGVAALLKYGVDQGWFRLPPELRLAGVAAAALAALVFAWRKRDSNRTFALSLQGGAIGVLLLVVFAAFKLFGVIPAGAAFALSIVLVAGAGMLAVLQDAKALAVFALLAGFLAPIWLSTGSGNHVALFSYYAVLNAAIVGIAWYRSWRVLNLLGFVFTFGIGTVWGLFGYAPEKYASTQPFLALFFVFYLLIPLLFARRQPASRRDVIDGCLVFGMPLVAFSLQAGLMQGGSFEDSRLPLAFCALGLGVLYAALSWALRRRANYDVLAQSYALLAVGFATLSVPLALSAQATACVFALEGAALAWLGVRQSRLLPQLTGGGLQIAAAVAFFIAQADAVSWHDTTTLAPMFANAAFMSALLIAIGGFASAWAYCQRVPGVALVYYLWALSWWLINGAVEIVENLGRRDEPDAMLVFVALTGWLAAEVHRRREAAALVATTLAGLASAALFALWQSDVHQQPFAGNGVWAWLAYAVLGVRSLMCLRDSDHRLAGTAQAVWWLVWPLVVSLLLVWIPDQMDGMGEGWRVGLGALPWLAVTALALYRWNWVAMPLGSRFDGCREGLLGVLFAVLALGGLMTLSVAGDAAPLPWIPVLNPLELAQLAALVLLLRWWGLDSRVLSPTRIGWLSALAFVWISSVVLHAVHHWGGEAWQQGLLSTSLAQTSLTLTWSVLGVLGWVAGSRRGQRLLWLAGAVLMGVVLVKLVLVDRQHLGNLLGIGSFIAFGLLCTVVGYVAPAPPRRAVEEEAAA